MKAQNKVKSRIDGVRNSNVRAFERTAKIAALVLEDFVHRGTFYRDGSRAFVLLRDSRTLLHLEHGETLLDMELLTSYGLLPAEFVSKHVRDNLRLRALGNGQIASVASLAKWDAAEHTLYVSNFANGVYRITIDAITLADNGTHDVLFLKHPQWEPFYLADGPHIDWHAHLTRGIRFEPRALSEDDRRWLFRIAVLMMFFPQLFPTKVIPTFIGPKGAAKSSLGRCVGRMIFGPRFDVAALGGELKDFDATITNDAFAVVDNVDKAPSWLEDRLAVIATGGSVKKRRLFTTNEQVEYPICATIWITSRTPDFRREDVAERLLPFYLQGLDQFTPENVVLQAVQEQRPSLMASLLNDLQSVVRALHAQRHAAPYRSSLRMADFASLASIIAAHEGRLPEMQDILERLSTEQVSFADEDKDEPLVDLMTAMNEWIIGTDSTVNVDREITSAELRLELQALVPKPWLLPWYNKSAKSFGQYLRGQMPALRQRFDIRERTAQGGQRWLSFRPRYQPPAAAPAQPRTGMSEGHR